MRCQCGSDSNVIDSRPLMDGHAIRRRRVCQECKARWTTYEVRDHSAQFVMLCEGMQELSDNLKELIQASKVIVHDMDSMKDQRTDDQGRQ